MPHHPTPFATPADFLTWPGGASLIYLVSAACLLAGAGLALAPAAGLEDRIGERLAMTGVVSLYLGALLGVACLVCHWRRDHGDAVALSILIALFLVAAAAPLDVLAVDRPGLSAVISGFLAGGGGLVVRVWCRRIGGPLPASVLVGGGLALLGAIAAPVVLGLLARHAGRTVPADLLLWWQGVAAVTDLGLAALWWGFVREPAASPRPCPSLLRSPTLPRILGLVVGAAAVAQTWLASYAVCLGLGWADLLLPLVLLALAADGLVERRGWLDAVGRGGVWTLLTLGGIVLLPAGNYAPLEAPLLHPAVAMAVGAAGLGWAAWRGSHLGLAALALVWAALAVAGAGAWNEARHLHVGPACGVLLIGLIGFAVRLRHPMLAVLGACGCAAAITIHVDLGFDAWALLAGGQILVLHVVFGERMPTRALLLGAALVAVGGAGLDTGLGWGQHLALLSMGIPGLWRDPRRLPALAPLALPLAGQVGVIAWHQPAWAAVGVAFLLLPVGAWFSRRQGGSEPGPAEAQPGDGEEQT